MIAQYKYVYFLGIGGIGMSALARWFNVNGFAVAGYDRTSTLLTQALEAEGVAVHYEDDPLQIPRDFLENKTETLVILTPAVPKDHRELMYFQEAEFLIQKRSQVLGLLAGGMFTVAVAGTHGKTTTSSMIAHLFRNAGVNCAAFLGGITQNYNTNLLINEPTDDLKQVLCVVEADEFDRSFLTLYPEVAVVTSTDADHLDIYGNHDSVLESFAAFASQIKNTGQLFMRAGLKLADKTAAQVSTYGLNEGAYQAENIRIQDAQFVFDVVYPQGRIENMTLQVPGFHNVENAIAAAAASLAVGLTPEQIRDGINTFKGVKRRFEYHLKTQRHVLIDDYAHHPTEVEAFLKSVKALYPQRHVTAIFQPHLFSRTQDFAVDFAESLSIADRVIVLDIYPARELPIEGVTAELISAQIIGSDVIQCANAELIPILKSLDKEVVVTIGAGDIDGLIQPIRALLEKV